HLNQAWSAPWTAAAILTWISAPLYEAFTHCENIFRRYLAWACNPPLIHSCNVAGGSQRSACCRLPMALTLTVGQFSTLVCCVRPQVLTLPLPAPALSNRSAGVLQIYGALPLWLRQKPSTIVTVLSFNAVTAVGAL